MNFVVLAYNRVKTKENEKRYKYLDFVRELKKVMEHEGDGVTSCDCELEMVHKDLVRELEELEDERRPPKLQYY